MQQSRKQRFDGNFKNLICTEKHLTVTEWHGCKCSGLHLRVGEFLGFVEMEKISLG